MLYTLALLASFAICAWIALDLVFSGSWRQRISSVATLAAAGACWVAGELLLVAAADSDSVLTGRRVVFLGVCLLGPAWLWCALEARRPGWIRGRAALLAAITLPSLVVYSTLYWEPSGSFVDWTAQPSRHGPVFFAHALYSWTLMAVGLHLLVSPSQGLSRPVEGRDRWLLLISVLAPLLANLSHVVLGPWPADPTPVMFGFSALALRSVVLHRIWGAYYLPFSRSGVVEQMDTAFMVADDRGLIVDANAAAFGLVDGLRLGHQSMVDVVTELENRPGAFEPQGFWLRRHGQVVGAGMLVADRTEQRRMEDELETTIRVEAIGHLAAGVSHEINNPLTYLKADLSLLEPVIAALSDARLMPRLPADVRDIAGESPTLLAECLDGAERIQRIVAQMDALTAVSDKELGPCRVDLRTLVDKACTMADLTGHDAKPRMTGRKNVAALAVEPDVRHILLHLLLNARQASGPGGDVEIRLEQLGEWAVVRVLDDGPGILEKDLPHLFDPFFTTRRPASRGLGLSLSLRLALKNHGRIEVANRAPAAEGDTGAVLSLLLPRNPHSTASSAPG